MRNIHYSKKNNSLFLVTTIVVVIALFVVFITNFKKNTTTDEEIDKIEATELKEGESLVISKADITKDASFYAVKVNDTVMEVIAVKDSKQNIRTAFNTCQICYGSGRGYYKQQKEKLKCQNCGNLFTMDQVEIETGGCNPWPISRDDKIENDDSIEISYDFLMASQDIFANWRNNY